MATQVQYRRGTNAQNTAFTGALGEITVDTTNGTLRVHDGITAGGSNIATVSYVTAQISSLSANAITFGTSNVQIPSSDGNVRVNVGGTSNVAVFATTGAFITGIANATGNITGGNITTAGQVSATANITGGNITTAGQVSATGNVSGGNLNITGGIVDTGALTIVTGSNGNVAITPNGTGILTVSTAASVTGNITGGNVLTAVLYTNTGNTTGAAIVNSGANGVGNIGSATGYFNTAHVKATSAQYADLAEMYVADANYEPGTVVEFGGSHEITVTKTSHSTAVAGIVSTNPSYLMNATQPGEHVLPIALTGRVPCRVKGPVVKGDVLVSADVSGVAQRIGINWQPGCVLGKALENIETNEVKIIEVAVGRL